MLRHVSDDARATTWFLVTRTVHGLLQFSTRTTFPSSTELMFHPRSMWQLLWQSLLKFHRWWENFNNISRRFLFARVTKKLMKKNKKKIKWAIKWKWDRSRCRLEKDDLGRIWTFIHIYVNFTFTFTFTLAERIFTGSFSYLFYLASILFNTQNIEVGNIYMKSWKML